MDNLIVVCSFVCASDLLLIHTTVCNKPLSLTHIRLFVGVSNLNHGLAFMLERASIEEKKSSYQSQNVVPRLTIYTSLSL